MTSSRMKQQSVIYDARVIREEGIITSTYNEYRKTNLWTLSVGQHIKLSKPLGASNVPFFRNMDWGFSGNAVYWFIKNRNTEVCTTWHKVAQVEILSKFVANITLYWPFVWQLWRIPEGNDGIGPTHTCCIIAGEFLSILSFSHYISAQFMSLCWAKFYD